MLAEVPMTSDSAPTEVGPAVAFDVGPLSWVHAEIGQSLARGLESLTAFKAAPSDPAPLKEARAHVHQAAGAIQMVGMEAVTVYTDEIERQLAGLEEPRIDVGDVIA